MFPLAHYPMNFLLVQVLMIALAIHAYAIPQYTLLSGNRCINCHFNVQGGGLRNDLGWYSNNDASLIKPEWIGLDGVYSGMTSNQALDNKLTFGLDLRVQSFRRYGDTSASRVFIPMQSQLNVALQAVEGIAVEGMFDLSAFHQQTKGSALKPGQQSWMGSVIIEPSLAYPQLRIGFFQPSIGLRYDDHTMYSRQLASDPMRTLIAPNFAELGAEATYYNFRWMSLTLGIFQNSALSKIFLPDRTNDTLFNPQTIVKSGSVSLLGKVAFTPKVFSEDIMSNVGASFYGSGDFSLIHFFAGLGLADLIAVQFDAMMQSSKDIRSLKSVSAEAIGSIDHALLLYARVEYGESRRESSVAFVDAPNSLISRQYVVGAKMFLLPFIEFRPEYRIVDNDLYTSGRWTAQLHIFY